MDNIKIDNQQANIPNMPNVEFQDVMVPFTGVWQSSIDPILIGFNNYQTLENIRYKKDGSGIEGINGYYDFNSTALSNPLIIDTGIHLKTDRSNDSYLIVHRNNSSGNAGRVSYSLSNIGGSEGSGSFESSDLLIDNANALNPRFSNGPGGVVVYCNGYDTDIYGGKYYPVGAVVQIEHSSTSSDHGYFEDFASQGWAFPSDITEIITNKDTTTYFNFSTAAPGKQGFIVFSPRQIVGINVSIVSGSENTNAANTNNISVQYYSSNAYRYRDVSSLSDGTSKMTQSGSLTFTTPDAIPHYYDDRFLYLYLVSISATSGTSSCNIYEITTIDTLSSIENVWDGLYRQPIQVQHFDNSANAYNDYTLHVNESSTEQTPVGLYIGQLPNSDYIYLMFDEPMSGFQFQMVGSLVNTGASKISDIKYWNGNSWVSIIPNPVNLKDTTLDSAGDSSWSQSGSVTWDRNVYYLNEIKKSMFGVFGYIYQISTDGITSGSSPNDVVIDLIGGIPRSKTMKEFEFSAKYKNRLMLCNYSLGNESNRIDYSIDNSPHVFNGFDSSNDGTQSIYVGSGDELTGAVQLYNRFGSNIYSILVITKNSETWLLTGDGPDSFQLYPISFNIGCPAPYTLITAEVGFSIGENVERNVAMWITQQGPVMFDGAVLNPVEGIETYFDPSSSKYINVAYLYKAQSWFDINYHEWNILLPTGASTTLNTWLVYNIRQRKWFKKNVNGNQDIYCGIKSLGSNGHSYIYGGSTDGKLYLLESGNSWDGNAITYKVKSGDFFPTNSQWDISLIRRLKLITKTSNTANTSLNVFMYKDLGSNSVSNSSVDLTTASTRLTKSDININQVGWCHAIELELTSNVAPKGFEPIMIGYQYQPTRKDV